ncbi:MAG: HEPN domain-containing protein [Nanoarchaeota archaeon]|nr:HEPN domain-containing protein [Nanoarchaeota archaeon]
MGKIDEKFKWCLKKGETGKNHKGIKKINPDYAESERQIKKAESDLGAMQMLYEGGRTDWVASAAFYSMYHSLLAVLCRFGYESRNQECSITFIEKFIEEGIIRLEPKYIAMIMGMQEGDKDAKSIREEMQYGSKTSMESERCRNIMGNAKEFVERIKELLEELKMNSQQKK